MGAPDFLETWSLGQLPRIERALEGWLGDARVPDHLGQAMRYAALGGGKRLRPLLVLAAAEAVQGHPQAALRAACAVELVHAYSLVHDDLPCMDNDVLRRGKPTVHVRFGEPLALLAGDALQTLAFELIVPEDAGIPEAMQARLSRLLAAAAGAQGMAGGQAIDLVHVGQPLTEAQLCDMHRRKTGALLRASVCMGAACAHQPVPPATWAALAKYGAAVGLAFQVVDDILDATADTATLGKTAGKDRIADKPTFVTILGLEKARAYAQQLLAQAEQALQASALAQTAHLRALARRLVMRHA
ncbi:MAG: polyprenyl synthetase family protein [Burkholderiaceae bacterium]|jgi:farnesyl diphosphate synthase|nr:polyprenyl synthetase family protein [Burkholderiaceae bacterium]